VAPGGRSGPGWPAGAVLCLGVWLHAADSLLAATVMPSAIAEIGGVAFIYWTVALYQLGSIVAGAITGILALRLGLRTAMTVAALIYGAGCTVSALAPDMAAMLLGRLLQGLGGGWMMALSHVGVTQLFPARRWPQLLAVISGVWGVSALVGPLIGGAFATAGLWRGAFWAFAVQALALAALMPLLLGRTTGKGARGRAGAVAPHRRAERRRGSGARRGRAGHQPRGAAAGGARARPARRRALVGAPAQPLFPPHPLDLRRPWGAGYVMILALSIATVSFTVYGPLLMETLFGVTPLVAGFMIAVESVSWTIAAIVFARAGARQEPALIRGGAVASRSGSPASRLDHAAGTGGGAAAPGWCCWAQASACAGRSCCAAWSRA
jgi:MFS family permease